MLYEVHKGNKAQCSIIKMGVGVTGNLGTAGVGVQIKLGYVVAMYSLLSLVVLSIKS